MNRLIAKHAHSIVNAAYWLENPEFTKTNKAQTRALEIYRDNLPFSLHRILKNLAFSSANLLEVSGESVVVPTGQGTVNKYMFRYPKGTDIESFKDSVEHQIELVSRNLGEIALNTHVTIKTPDIFRIPIGPVATVTQIQPKIDTLLNPPFRLSELADRPRNINSQTLRDLESLFDGCDKLFQEAGMYPDLYDASHNLRINTQSGHLALIDVMPLYSDGTRLIGDLKPNTNKIGLLIERARENILGNYGT